MSDRGTKDDLDDEINETLFGQTDVIDFSKMRRDDLLIFKQMLESDQSLLIAKRLAGEAGVGQGKAIDMVLGEGTAEDMLGLDEDETLFDKAGQLLKGKDK